MDITSAALIYFSPTGTTRKIIESIAQGVRIARAEHLDLTPLEAMPREFAAMHDDLAIIGSSVYGGRLPAEMVSRFRRLKGNGAPAVIVAVYGNRAYEDALLELRDLALEAGFKPIAAGAFIGEHSYSAAATPIAVGRPDAEDLRNAEEFGRMIRERMRSLDGMSPPQVPGNSPYKEWAGLSGISPVIQEALCARCERCASVCPTAAISVQDAMATDATVCIKCCACVKACAAGARTMEDPRIRQVAELLSMNCRERKEPETYM